MSSKSTKIITRPINGAYLGNSKIVECTGGNNIQKIRRGIEVFGKRNKSAMNKTEEGVQNLRQCWRLATKNIRIASKKHSAEQGW